MVDAPVSLGQGHMELNYRYVDFEIVKHAAVAGCDEAVGLVIDDRQLQVALPTLTI